jgi:hypothetical protein
MLMDSNKGKEFFLGIFHRTKGRSMDKEILVLEVQTLDSPSSDKIQSS